MTSEPTTAAHGHDEILAKLDALRAADAPTHGGRLLSYVYDSGRDDLDALAAAAIARMQPVNGLDPTAFTSVAAIERDLVAFAVAVLGGSDAIGGDEVVGTVTSGGTESCLLAVKTARDAWRTRTGATGDGPMPRLVATVSVHAAFRKAAALFDVRLDLVPVSAESGEVDPDAVLDRVGDGADVCLVVLSAPSYPYAALDPIAELAPRLANLGVDVHVDACIGGFALAFWPEEGPAWDLSVPGVTSLSADLHKYGFAPKGVSVLLQRGRDRQRRQWFATATWPGYPVVNPTLLGSRSAAPAAAAWAIVQALGEVGFWQLTDATAAATRRLVETVDGIEGLRVIGTPTGPMLAATADLAEPEERRVDPHLWADAVRRRGFVLQLQPGYAQPDGDVLPTTTHLTVTPITTAVLDELATALVDAADEVRGEAPIHPGVVLAALGAALPPLPLDADGAAAVLDAAGLLDAEGLPTEMAPVMALIGALPAPIVEQLLVELLARGLE